MSPSGFARRLAIDVPPRPEAGGIGGPAAPVPQPVTFTVVIVSTPGFDARNVATGSLRLAPAEREADHVADRPRGTMLRDVDGDGLEDLVALFELDWTELWDGWETAALTGRLAGGAA